MPVVLERCSHMSTQGQNLVTSREGPSLYPCPLSVLKKVLEARRF